MTAPPTGVPQGLTAPAGEGVGTSPRRPDGTPKVKGEFAYGSDMWMDGMIWGVTLRSPHPYARIRSIDIGSALAAPGVYAVLTHEDVPGSKFYGLEIVDQPVLAVDTVRYQGEPVALVAADHPELARQAAKRIRVDYDMYEPVTDAREALGHPRWNQVHDAPGTVSELSRERAVLHPQGNLVRHLQVRKGEPEPVADVVVIGEYEVGMQDQAFLGPESGLAVPARTAASSCTLRRNGCTWTSGRSVPRWPCPRRWCGSRWPGWAARSAAARTCRCTCTRACWRCTPASR